ncbi:type II toxin-antitoxin system PemK/MazF family toxin [Siminovitchia sp. 179-K 8D1 HS]|uniref:type II toxin-antitoxin system PemK/MazF family toxin n=1 Tax=Siminovitchia sp. 179-K 8D1 HS TaxID=3142385 RepID=UPI0039A0DEC2
MSYFINKERWKEIERGFEFEAAMLFPSDAKRPLSFFVPDEGNAKRGSITTEIGDFSPIKVGETFKANTQQIVMNIKPRKVVVLSSDEINKNENFEYILVAPINTIKPNQKIKDWYKQLISDRNPIFTYLPKGNLDRYIDLSQTIGIHKSLLLKKYSYIGKERMEILENDLLQCLSLGIIDEESIEE